MFTQWGRETNEEQPQRSLYEEGELPGARRADNTPLPTPNRTPFQVPPSERPMPLGIQTVVQHNSGGEGLSGCREPAASALGGCESGRWPRRNAARCLPGSAKHKGTIPAADSHAEASRDSPPPPNPELLFRAARSAAETKRGHEARARLAFIGNLPGPDQVTRV